MEDVRAGGMNRNGGFDPELSATTAFKRLSATALSRDGLRLAGGRNPGTSPGFYQGDPAARYWGGLATTKRGRGLAPGDSLANLSIESALGLDTGEISIRREGHFAF